MNDTKPVLSNSAYDALKWVALVALPALAVFYLAVAALWDLPKPQEVSGTIIALDTLLGLLLGVANKNYMNSDTRFDGVLNVDEKDNRLIHQLDIHTDPEVMATQDAITLKVNQVPPDENL